MRNDPTLLHLDEDPATLRLVGQSLATYGYRVTPIASPREFLAHLPRHEERVVLMETTFTGIDGLEVLQRIKAFDGGIQVIMLADCVAMSVLMDAMRCGAEACFFKPLTDFSPLVQAITCSFRKIERWWQTLEELSCRKRLPADGLQQALEALSHDSEFCRPELTPLAPVNFGA